MFRGPRTGLLILFLVALAATAAGTWILSGLRNVPWGAE